MEKRLSELTAVIPHIKRVNGLQAQKDPLVSSLVYDSRKVTRNSLFFALDGLHVDGKRFIPQAIEKGASVIIHQGELSEYDERAVYVQVTDSRFVMSPVADAFFDHPSKKLTVIGVTGTEGKSTTVFLIYQLLRLAGKKTGFISTVQYSLGDEEVNNPEHQTTPEAPIVHEKLYQMLQNGAEYAVVESSSHGLSKKTNRLGDVRFSCGAMMNVTHEHLEFHGTHEQYKSDKANLFRAVEDFAVVNMEDPSWSYFASVTEKPIYGFATRGTYSELYGASQDAQNSRIPCLIAADIASDSDGVSFSIDGIPVRINLPGAFNVYNVLAALLIVSHTLKQTVNDLYRLLPLLRPVRGRMTGIKKGQPFEVIVDYAHTPSSFETIFPPLRKRLDADSGGKGRIISLFGSGGERDTAKRAQQGKIASHYCDIVVLADEDPRGEDPCELLEMIACGCSGLERNKTLFIIPDRPSAIRKAFTLARNTDIVLLLGKAHENSIIYKDHVMAYDEITEAESALAEMGYKE